MFYIYFDIELSIFQSMPIMPGQKFYGIDSVKLEQDSNLQTPKCVGSSPTNK